MRQHVSRRCRTPTEFPDSQSPRTGVSARVVSGCSPRRSGTVLCRYRIRAEATVEEIAAARRREVALPSTRHFSGKAALAVELFKQASDEATPRLLQIGSMDFRQRDVVSGGRIRELFAADRDNRRLLRVFIQATANEPGFTERAQELIEELIAGLGQMIPAFAVDKSLTRRRWLEAWLLLYEILDQSNHAALEWGVAEDPLVVDILAERFLRFVTDDARG